LRDLHALDTLSLTWFQGPGSGAPSARHGHTATLHESRLCVFGGVGARYFGDFHCLDLVSMAWSSPESTGPRPTPRSGHAALLIGESLVIHGGFCIETDVGGKDNKGQLLKNAYLNDIRVLDLRRMLWSRLRTHGVPPSGRFGHTLVLSEDDAVLIGGWSGSNTLPQQTGKDSSSEQTCDYCVTLRTADMTWVNNRYVGMPATRRYGHTATPIGPHIVVFGGFDGCKPLHDVIVLRDRHVGEKGFNRTPGENADTDVRENQSEAEKGEFTPDSGFA